MDSYYYRLNICPPMILLLLKWSSWNLVREAWPHRGLPAKYERILPQNLELIISSFLDFVFQEMILLWYSKKFWWWKTVGILTLLLTMEATWGEISFGSVWNFVVGAPCRIFITVSTSCCIRCRGPFYPYFISFITNSDYHTWFSFQLLAPWPKYR